MKKQIDRRHLLLSSLFGAGALGLRSLASGIPAAVLLNPRKALADVDAGTGACLDKGKAQYLILSVSSGGDPIGCNVPGTYDDPTSPPMPVDFATVGHPTSPAFSPVPLMMGGTPYLAAGPWGMLSSVMPNTCFFHNATDTPIHTDAEKVLEVSGASLSGEMLPSAIAKYTAPCLGTIQTQPVCVGLTPQNTIQFDGQNLPQLSAANLAQILTTTPGSLQNLQSMRDNDLNRINSVLKSSGTAQQRAFIDAYATSQTQLRSVSEVLFQQLAGFTAPGTPADQLSAAVTLIQMKLAPVFVVYLPFGGDNHADNILKQETADHLASLTALQGLMAQLATLGLKDQVTFASWNVFGRLMNVNNMDQGVGQGVGGRDHNEDHHCMIMIGNNVKSSVIGGITAFTGISGPDFGARDIQSAGSTIPKTETLASAAKTLMVACGVDQATTNTLITNGSVVPEALA